MGFATDQATCQDAGEFYNDPESLPTALCFAPTGGRRWTASAFSGGADRGTGLCQEERRARSSSVESKHSVLVQRVEIGVKWSRSQSALFHNGETECTLRCQNPSQ